MKITVLVSKWCPVCEVAEEILKKLKEEHNFELEILDVTSEKGRKIVEEKGIRKIPATLIDGVLVFSGLPEERELKEILSGKRVVIHGSL